MWNVEVGREGQSVGECRFHYCAGHPGGLGCSTRTAGTPAAASGGKSWVLTYPCGSGPCATGFPASGSMGEAGTPREPGPGGAETTGPALRRGLVCSSGLPTIGDSSGLW